MISPNAKKNLEKDARVLGDAWDATYGGYFSDTENIQYAVEVIDARIPDAPIDVLYVASAAGLLGEELLKHHGAGILTLVDISEKHLFENKNPHTTKICDDISTFNLGKEFDVILMRSALDYFPTEDMQVDVLRRIKDHLKKGGLFFNQPAFVGDLHDRDVISGIYTHTEKIGDRLFQSTDIEPLYEKAGFTSCEKIGEGERLHISDADHIARYGLDTQDVSRIQDMIDENTEYMRVTDRGYELDFDFPMYLATY